MYKGMWRKACALLASGVTAISLNGSPLQAQDSELDLLRQRLQRLEEQNQRLQETVNSQTYPTSTVDSNAVEKIVAGYLKQQLPQPGPAPTPAEGEEGWHEVGSDLGIHAWWDNGLFMGTRNRDFVMRLRGRLFYDGGVFKGADAGMPAYDDAQAIRSARLGFEGRLWEVFKFRADFDFADPDGLNGSTFLPTHGPLAPAVVANDLYVEMNKLPYVGNIRAGYFKEPFGLEQQTSLSNTTFMERSLIDMGRPTLNTTPHTSNELYARGLVPGRNTGIMMHNTWLDDRLFGAIGWFRTQSSLTGFDSGDGNYAYTGRIAGLPYWQHNGRGLVHLGAAFSHRDYDPLPDSSFLVSGVVNANQPRYQARPLTLGTPALLDTGDINNVNSVNLYGAEFAWVAGKFSVQSEIVGASLNRTSGGNLDYWGYYVNASIFLTGENRRYNKSIASFDRVIPLENFFCVSGSEYESNGSAFSTGLGAWELAARYSMIDLGSPNYASLPGTGVTSPPNTGGTGTVEELTLGVNWYWNPNMRWMMNYVHTRRDSVDVANSGDVDMLAWRFQVDW